METIDLRVAARQDSGKGAAGRLRREGRIPAILYGRKKDPSPLSLDQKEFSKRVAALEGSHLLRLASDDAALEGRLALVKEVQRHPTTQLPLHVDLYEVDLAQKIRVRVPLHFVGKAAGVELGGILQPLQRDVEVLCLPSEIPEFIEVDVSPLAIHDSLHLSELTHPPGSELVWDNDEPVATVLPPIAEPGRGAAAGSEGAKA